MKLKDIVNEIGINPQYSKSRDNVLRRAVKGLFEAPPQLQGDAKNKAVISKYLTDLQTWAARHLKPAQNGALVDVASNGIYLNLPNDMSGKNILFLDDEYVDVDDMYEDMSDAIAGKHVSTNYIWISPAHVARYVLGEEWYERIVIPGR